MRQLYAFLAGGIFGTGLLISGMTDTLRVQGWLDVFGNWDPTLAFVLGGAIVPMAIAWRYSMGRRPVLGGAFPARPESRVGRNLVIGSVIFGMGWGLSGLCPGPSIATLSFNGVNGVVFVVSMVAGMFAAPMVRLRIDSAFGGGERPA